MAAVAPWPVWSYQPVRLIYQLVSITSLLSRLPLWVFTYWVSRGRRPRQEWTVQQSVMAKVVRGVVDVQSTIGITATLSLKPGAEKERFHTVPPFGPQFYQGPLVSDKVRPELIGGTWYPKPLGSGSDDVIKLAPEAFVVLHLHGGAFVTGDGRTAATGYLAGNYTGKVGAAAVFCPQYRLAGYRGRDPFPAALQDTLTSYLYLVQTLQIPAEQIVLSGDSAGGNLAIGLLRYLERYGEGLGVPPPRCCVLVSPWVRPGEALGPDVVLTSNPNWDTDLLPVSFLRWGARAYSQLVPVGDEWITPLGRPFATGGVPLFVTVGAAELFEMDNTHWAAEMAAVPGNSVETHYEPHAVHDTMLVGGSAGWDESTTPVCCEIAGFIRRYGQA